MHGLIFNSVFDTFTTVDPSGSNGTTLNGINDRGDIVGYFIDGAGDTDGTGDPGRSCSQALPVLGLVAYRRSPKAEFAGVIV
jgi:hypothetical protein